MTIGSARPRWRTPRASPIAELPMLWMEAERAATIVEDAYMMLGQ